MKKMTFVKDRYLVIVLLTLLVAVFCSVFIKYKNDFTILIVFNGDHDKEANNLLGSIKKNAPQLLPLIEVCASDQSSKDFALNNGLKWFAMDEISQFGSFRTKEMNRMTERKFECIIKLLHEKRTLLYVDTDVVFIEDPLPYIDPSSDLNIQNDQCTRPYNFNNLCTGFMYIKPNRATIELFTEAKEIIRDSGYVVPDQDALIMVIKKNIVNDKHNKHNLSITVLDECIFPNGCRYFDLTDETCSRNQAKIVHGNWLVGVDNKLKRFDKYGLSFAQNR